MNLIKTIFISLFFIVNLLSAQDGRNKFEIFGQIEGNYNGYLFFNYNDKKDSCLVVANKFYFSGITSEEIVYATRFLTNRTSSMDKDVFLENKKIYVTIEIQRKKYNETEYDWIVLKDISGTQTSELEKEYSSYIASLPRNENWQKNKYKKIDEIVSLHPKNHFSGELLYFAAQDSIANFEDLKLIFQKIDTVAQNSNLISNIKEMLYPREKIQVGDFITDFELPNENNILINTESYRGNILIIDFWASWCVPCRKKLPQLTKLYEKVKLHNVKILSVSLDADRLKWIKAIQKENMKWDNVLENGEFDGEVVKTYGVKAIPSIFLIDDKGVLIAIDPSIGEMEKIIMEKINKKSE
ncbi:peroxiredoxin [Flavobacterium aquaticum]|jgi:thiol-disulfide isomerase/thioredoxin|uniref:Peroxiredoxin n=1 Tax=Flavobacterium aquaticum TaxID=1236486 RepID=A0A327YFE1_9FLAO|nr:TlpA disulfide reductase family protein [Flavobacterium aquaticum]RAK19750.1 peroxiredoxin [Flavobacterium aquaticum]